MVLYCGHFFKLNNQRLFIIAESNALRNLKGEFWKLEENTWGSFKTKFLDVEASLKINYTKAAACNDYIREISQFQKLKASPLLGHKCFCWDGVSLNSGSLRSEKINEVIVVSRTFLESSNCSETQAVYLSICKN